MNHLEKEHLGVENWSIHGVGFKWELMEHNWRGLSESEKLLIWEEDMQKEGVLVTEEWHVESLALETSKDLPLYSSERRRVHGM